MPGSFVLQSLYMLLKDLARLFAIPINTESQKLHLILDAQRDSCSPTPKTKFGSVLSCMVITICNRSDMVKLDCRLALVTTNLASQRASNSSDSPPLSSGSFFFRSSLYSPNSKRKLSSYNLTSELLAAHAEGAQNAAAILILPGGFIPISPLKKPSKNTPKQLEAALELKVGLVREHATFTIVVAPDNSARLIRCTTRPSARKVIGFALRAKHANYPTARFSGEGVSVP